jgi:Glycosyl transferases group 1
MTNVETEKAPAPATVPEIVRDPYGMATAAAERLAHDVTDEEARSAYVQALARLKLLDAARRSVVPWTSRARRFAANLRALEERAPAGAALVRAAAGNLSPYELHVAADGNFQILDTTAPVWKGWLGGLRGQLTDHKATEQLWQYDSQHNPLPPPMLFDSMGFGWLFLHALRTTEQAFLNYRCAFYVLERDPLMLAMAMHLHDMQEVIRSPRVRWFIGATDEEVLSEFRTGLTENTSWTLPQLFVRSNLRPRARLAIEETIDEIGSLRQKQRAAWAAEAKAYYDGKDAAFWQARFSAVIDGKAGAQPLRVLGLTSRYTTVLKYSMAEMQEAVGQWTTPAGGSAEMRTAIEPDDQSTENPFLETIATFKPDLIFQISRMRYENGLLPQNVPFLCWDQDNLSCMRTPQATASLDRRTYVAGPGAVFGYANLNWPRGSCVFCHPAGATFRYCDRPIDDAARSRHECDVSYVSNASGTPEDLAATLLKRWNHARGVVLFKEAAAIIRAQSDAGETWDFFRILNLLKSMECGVELGAGPRDELAADLRTYADRCFRHAALGWVSRWCLANGRTLRLYGRGWEHHPEWKQWAAGIAEPGEETRAIFQASRINLQLIESGFIHSRSLDGLAAGGFFLHRTSTNDCTDPIAGAAQQDLAKFASALGLSTKRDLDTCSHPVVSSAWASIRAGYDSWQPDARISGLAMWNHVPPPRLVFPELPQISFSNAAEFATLAEKYLRNEGLRVSLAAEMREIVLNKMSYTRRWEQFLTGIRDGLADPLAPEGAPA